MRNEIDLFIQKKLQGSSLSPAEEASRQTLIRRLYLDLTGLPPTREELQEYLDDTSPDAYEKLVDRVLESKHFGQRMAWDWQMLLDTLTPTDIRVIVSERCGHGGTG